MKQRDVRRMLLSCIEKCIAAKQFRRAQRLLMLAMLHKRRTHRERVEVGQKPLVPVDVFQLQPKQFAAEFIFNKDEVKIMAEQLGVGDRVRCGTTKGKQVECSSVLVVWFAIERGSLLSYVPVRSALFESPIAAA